MGRWLHPCWELSVRWWIKGVCLFFFFYIVLFSKTVFTYFRESRELMTWGGAEGEGEFPADSPLHVELDVRLIPTTVRS